MVHLAVGSGTKVKREAGIRSHLSIGNSRLRVTEIFMIKDNKIDHSLSACLSLYFFILSHYSGFRSVLTS